MAKSQVASKMLHELDAGARVLWEVQGPRDGGARVQAILAKIGGERMVFMAIINPDDTVELFEEINLADRTKELKDQVQS